MAAIQPKNTDNIKVNIINEKTAASKVSFPDGTKIDSIVEYTGAAGVSLNAILKCTTLVLPLSSTIDLGNVANHFREMLIKEVTSSGQALSVGTDSAHSLTLKSNALDRVAIESDGDLAQDATNGGNLLWTKTSTAVAQAAATALTAAGTVITDALDLTSVFNHLTTVAASTGVQLWDAPIGAQITVINGGANALLVYPHSGAGTINGGVAGASVSVATATYNIFVRVSSTNWIGREIASAAA